VKEEIEAVGDTPYGQYVVDNLEVFGAMPNLPPDAP
jgi:hypothetical protein